MDSKTEFEGHWKSSVKVLALVALLSLTVIPSLAVTSAATASSAASGASICSSGYGLTPSGCEPLSCIYQINDPDATIVQESNGMTLITYSNGMTQTIAPCTQSGYTPLTTTNGWVEDAENVVKTKQMSGSWVVPGTPSKNSGQTIFEFIGTQNCVCGSAFILQPVIQWGSSAAGGGAFWALASWYVDSNYFVSKLIDISAGDVINGTIKGNKCTSIDCNWKIVGEDVTAGTSTKLKVTDKALQFDDFVTLEVYGVTACDQYPSTSPTTFTSLLVNSKSVSAWSLNVLQNDGCGEAVTSPISSTVLLAY
jgi:hypothetical protein